ncbi:MAG: DUF2782 domain-containing protein [Gallionellaceae bacterium]
MRLFSVLLLACFSVATYAADAPPANLQPMQPPPKMDANAQQDSDLEPQVTIVKKKDTVVEEYRMHGKLYKIKVIPKVGKPYFMIDSRGDGEFSRYDGPDGANISPPRWVIFSF